jgi:hypothetical protein
MAVVAIQLAPQVRRRPYGCCFSTCWSQCSDGEQKGRKDWCRESCHEEIVYLETPSGACVSIDPVVSGTFFAKPLCAPVRVNSRCVREQAAFYPSYAIKFR